MEEQKFDVLSNQPEKTVAIHFFERRWPVQEKYLFNQGLSNWANIKYCLDAISNILILEL